MMRPRQRDLDRTEQFFHRRAGLTTVFVARFVPVIRHFISIPAGIGRIPLLSFSLVTLIGGTMRNSVLLFLGMNLRDHWRVLQTYWHQADIVIVALGVVAAAWWYWSRRRQAR